MNPKITELTVEELRSLIKSCIDEVLYPEDILSTFDRLHDKLDKLLEVNRSEERMESANLICDKFEDYMKNVDKLNGMINEFKGLIAITRAGFKGRNA